MEHLNDFVWMQKEQGELERVEANSELISQKMVAGYSQVFPDFELKKEDK
jgi:hypothetical protein